MSKTRLTGTTYAIACYKEDDSAPYYGDGDSWQYFTENGIWSMFECAEQLYTEQMLVNKLKEAYENEETINLGLKPFPVIIETTVSQFESDSLDSLLLKTKRDAALNKLTYEDKVALGLNK